MNGFYVLSFLDLYVIIEKIAAALKLHRTKAQKGKCFIMPITEILERNAKLYGDDVSLVEINPPDTKSRFTWKEYSLIESGSGNDFRRSITWEEFNRQANRFANFLLSRGVKKGDKVAILLMNCLEWLPVYFGVLKAGAIAVPLNYRYTAEEIKYCLGLSD